MLQKLFYKKKNIQGELISTFFYSGLIKFAPGTMGSFLGILASGLLLKYGGLLILIIFFLLSWAVGYFQIKNYISDNLNSDPKEVVIDEVAGQALCLLSLIAVNYCAFKFNLFHTDLIAVQNNFFWIFFVNFVCFRIFDITKIFPVSYFDNQTGPSAIINDDLIAGFMGGIFHYFALVVLKIIGII